MAVLPRSSRAAYLRVAHIYMLISIPTDTSTIFGAFQAILALPLIPDELAGAGSVPRERFKVREKGSSRQANPTARPSCCEKALFRTH